jgi:hypothetical protein
MNEYVPIALGCGHHVQGAVEFVKDELAGRLQLKCPEGCGPQDWLAEPPGLHKLEQNVWFERWKELHE